MSTSAFTTTLAPIDQPVINVRHLEKTFGRGSTIVPALRGIDLDIGRGELTAIMDPSGSGKSTLMHCIVRLEGATAGTVTIDGRKIGQKRFDTLLTRSALPIVSSTGRPSCPVVSSSASRVLVPWLAPPTWSWPMSRPVTSTRKQPHKSCCSFASPLMASARRSSWSLTNRTPRHGRTG